MTMELNGDISFEVPELEGEIHEMEPIEWNDILNKPTDYPPEAHTQGMSTITGLEAKFAEAFATIEEKVDADYVDGEIARVEGEIPSLDGYATERYVDEAVAEVQGDVDGIEAKIPAQATPQNKLADREFVNSSISTNTATFRGTYTSTDDFPTTGVDDNDYVFLKVMSTEEPTQVEKYDRYKWNGTQFAFEFSLNNSSFTAEQWSAINSGITAGTLSTILSDISDLKSDITTAKENINNLQNVVPTEATTSNTLADKAYVGTQITNAIGNAIGGAY